jgi:hypothetical protein
VRWCAAAVCALLLVGGVTAAAVVTTTTTTTTDTNTHHHDHPSDSQSSLIEPDEGSREGAASVETTAETDERANSYQGLTCPGDCVLCCVIDTTELDVPVKIAEFVDVLSCHSDAVPVLQSSLLRPRPKCLRSICERGSIEHLNAVRLKQQGSASGSGSDTGCNGFFRSRREFDACYQTVNATMR